MNIIFIRFIVNLTINFVMIAHVKVTFGILCLVSIEVKNESIRSHVFLGVVSEGGLEG